MIATLDASSTIRQDTSVEIADLPTGVRLAKHEGTRVWLSFEKDAL